MPYIIVILIIPDICYVSVWVGDNNEKYHNNMLSGCNINIFELRKYINNITNQKNEQQHVYILQLFWSHCKFMRDVNCECLPLNSGETFVMWVWWQKMIVLCDS